MTYFLICVICISLGDCATDKLLHTITSFSLTKVSYVYYTKNTNYTNNWVEVASFITTLSLGFIKELVDKKFDWKDINANLVGIGVALFILTVLLPEPRKDSITKGRCLNERYNTL